MIATIYIITKTIIKFYERVDDFTRPDCTLIFERYKKVLLDNESLYSEDLLNECYDYVDLIINKLNQDYKMKKEICEIMEKQKFSISMSAKHILNEWYLKLGIFDQNNALICYIIVPHSDSSILLEY